MIPQKLPNPTNAPPVPWITLATAAERSGQSEGHLRRRCGQEWLAQGLAKTDTYETGQRGWWIREDADPSFARVKSIEQLDAAVDLTKLTDAHRAQILERKAILDGWDSAVAAGMHLGMSKDTATTRYLERLTAEGKRGVCRATLYGWRTAYRKDGLAGLIDERRERSSGASALTGDPFLSYFASIYLTQKRLKIALCHAICEQKAVEQGWEVRSYKACQRFVASLDPALVTKKREGEKAFVDKHEPNIRRDYSTLDSNSLWCSDHYRFDVMVRDPKDPTKVLRPWLTSWQDVRSRKILGWRIFAGDPNTDTILGAFTDAAAEYGLPVSVYVDNGKDFASRAFHGITAKERRKAGPDWRSKIDKTRIEGAWNILQIEPLHAWPYHGQSKPIERFHNTLTDRFCRQQDTYTGNSTENKPENLQDQIEAGKALTLQEFTEAFSAWLASDYNGRGHTGDSMGMTPDQAFAQCLISKRTTTREILIFACMPRFGPVKVGQDGVTYRGVWYGGFDSQVQRLFGQQVILAIDNSDLSRLLILDTSGRLICPASANRKLAFNSNSQDLRDAIQEKRQLRKRIREYDQARPRMAMASDTQALLERSAARRQLADAQQSGTPLPPATVQAIQTGLEGQQDEIQRALDGLSRQPLRKAVNDDLVHDDSIDVGQSFMRLASDDDGDHRRGDIFDRIVSATPSGEGEL